MKLKNILFAFVMLGCIFSCKEKAQQPIPQTPAPAPVVVKDTTPKVPVVVEEKKPVRNKVQNYFLIAGCFEYRENADKLSAKLQKEGYDSKVVLYFENLYLVSYDGFPTRKEALDALKEYIKEPGKEQTWIYNSKSIQ